MHEGVLPIQIEQRVDIVIFLEPFVSVTFGIAILLRLNEVVLVVAEDVDGQLEKNVSNLIHVEVRILCLLRLI